MSTASGNNFFPKMLILSAPPFSLQCIRARWLVLNMQKITYSLNIYFAPKLNNVLRSSSSNILFCCVFHSTYILPNVPQYLSLNCGFSYPQVAALSLLPRTQYQHKCTITPQWYCLFPWAIMTWVRCWRVHSWEGAVPSLNGDQESAWEVGPEQLTWTPRAMYIKAAWPRLQKALLCPAAVITICILPNAMWVCG